MSRIAILILCCAVIASVSSGRIARQLGGFGAPSDISIESANSRISETFKIISAGEGSPKIK